MTFAHDESALVQLVKELEQDSQKIKIVLTANETKAQKVEERLKALAHGTLSEHEIVSIPGFFQCGVFRYESAKKIIAKRLSALKQMANHSPRVMVCSVAGLTRIFPSPAWLIEHQLVVNLNSEIDVDLLLEELTTRAYLATQHVEEVGEYAVRGSIVDVWTPGEAHPTRIEFFGDRVEKIRSFHAATQRSFANTNTLTILPCREFTWPLKSQMQTAVEKLNAVLLTQKIVGTSRSNLLEDLKAGIPFAGIDDCAYMFSQTRFVSLYEQVQEKQVSFCLLDTLSDLNKAITEIEHVYTQAQASAENKNILTGRCDALFPYLPALREALPHVTSLKSEFSVPQNIAATLEQLETQKFSARAQWLSTILEKQELKKLVICTPNANSFIEFAGIAAKYLPSLQNANVTQELVPFSSEALQDDAPACLKPISQTLFVTLLNLEKGFFLPHTQTLFLSESWIRGTAKEETFEDFSTKEKTPDSFRAKSEAFLSAQFSDFVDGELVVHVQHGIARFRGLLTIKLMDMSGDFLALEYANNDKIYVPVHKLNLIQKYIGSSTNVMLDSLKSTQWEKRKEKAKKDVEKLALELMEHQAKRAMTPGHAFSKMSEEDMAFEDAFPFDETPDQLTAITEILADMQKPKAMDRLLCGDVGFGKTEVAMRAAYKCVLDGKQVAWLVPTTVLAHQHFRSLKERFHSFGVQVQMLDRSVGSTAQMLDKLKQGNIDILIGTHRLLSKDIAFRDLGLLIVDEEQRFGVLQKEKIKAMSYGVDVLTMTATPIPRTLQMAMVGLRDLSLLTTPPKSRLATKTFVCPFEDTTVLEAIQQEINRGGQVFYVHNRVEELDAVLVYLQTLLPKLRICVGHGKLTQKELETTILEFLDGKYDVLLCTTIIESGIDMPNVNTILVQNANNFGLAQLYQLRGRVGRRSARGFAYFLTAPDIQKNDEGLRRLEVLQDHQELGSGFVIASHDLEMRGSGNILGDEQSGRVSDVGLETYLQMLDDAIKKLGGMKSRAQNDVEIQLPFPAHIPENYIENPRERLRTYRRFFGMRQESALQNLMGECEDRFGPLPVELQNLAEVARVRHKLLMLNAVSLVVGDSNTELRLDKSMLQSDEPDNEMFIKRLLDACNHRVKNMRITVDGKIIIPLHKKDFTRDLHAPLSELKRILSLLVGEVALN